MISITSEDPELLSFAAPLTTVVDIWEIVAAIEDEVTSQEIFFVMLSVDPKDSESRHSDAEKARTRTVIVAHKGHCSFHIPTIEITVICSSVFLLLASTETHALTLMCLQLDAQMIQC